jgi:hypothetical protein
MDGRPIGVRRPWTLVTMKGSVRHDSVRRSYDTIAEQYAAGFRDELARKPLDRALLACLIEQAEKGAPIADLGCGPGHASAWARLERTSYPGEIETRRAYLLARRQT